MVPRLTTKILKSLFQEIEIFEIKDALDKELKKRKCESPNFWKGVCQYPIEFDQAQMFSEILRQGCENLLPKDYLPWMN